MTEVLAWGILCVLATAAGLYVIALAPMRYNGGRSDAKRYRENWHTGEKLAMIVLVAVFAVVAMPVMVLVEVIKSGK